MSTAPIVRSASLIDSSIWRARGHEELDAAAQDLLEEAHALDRALEDRHLRAHPERDHRRVVADHPAADHQHARRCDTRDTAEQDPAPALRLLEVVRACLRGESPGDLAHRREQRQRTTVGLDRLVRDCSDSRVDEHSGQRLVGGDVEVGEKRQALAEPRILRRDRLLDLEQQVSAAPHLVDGDDRRARPLVGLVGESAARARVGLDEHVVPTLNELAGAGRRQRDPVLLRLDLFGYADAHRARDDSDHRPGYARLEASSKEELCTRPVSGT